MANAREVGTHKLSRVALHTARPLPGTALIASWSRALVSLCQPTRSERLQLCSVAFADNAQTNAKFMSAVRCGTGESWTMSIPAHAIGAGTRLRLNPLDASYIIGLNASALFSGALSSSFMIAI